MTAKTRKRPTIALPEEGRERWTSTLDSDAARERRAGKPLVRQRTTGDRKRPATARGRPSEEPPRSRPSSYQEQGRGRYKGDVPADKGQGSAYKGKGNAYKEKGSAYKGKTSEYKGRGSEGFRPPGATKDEWRSARSPKLRAGEGGGADRRADWRGSRPERPWRPERPERPDRRERPERPGRTEQAERAPRLPHHELRQAVIDVARRMTLAGINQGKSGNVSARVPEGFLITPSGLAYERMSPADVVLVHLDGRYEGTLAPSSEWRIHRDLYAARPECGAIVHTHAPYATTLACAGRGLPPFHYMVAVAGGHDIRCAPYATFGTQALSDHALAALERRKACLLANHGMIAFGRDLEAALLLAAEVEALCGQYWRVLQIGEPVLLSGEEMDLVVEKFATYGQPQPASSAEAGRGDAEWGRPAASRE